MSAAAMEALGGWSGVLERLVAGTDLTRDQAGAVLAEVLEGSATPAQIAGLVVALRAKRPAIEEVAGMVDAMLAAAAPIELPAGVDAVDIVGTGGAPARREAALNVSTMAAFVAAGAGVVICKHGNRSASSTSGSSDVLEALGVAIELDGSEVAHTVAACGLGFCFARAFHPAMRHVAPVRAELGIPTVFNLLGPLSHPARLRRQVVGVSDGATSELVAGVLLERGATHALVVHGAGQLDELSLSGPSEVLEVRDGSVRRFTVEPESLGFELVDPSALRGGTPADNAAIAHRVFAGERGPIADIVVLNAAAALVVGDRADSLAEGVQVARESIDSGAAAAKLAALVEVAGR